MKFCYLLECHGSNGPGRDFSQLRSNRVKRTGATNVPGDVGHANDLADSRPGAHYVGDTIHNNLRDSGYSALGGHGNGQGGIFEKRSSQKTVVYSVTRTTSNHSDR